MKPDENIQDFGQSIGCPPGIRIYDFARHKIGSVVKLEAEINRLRQALLDAWGKAELGAKIVEKPAVAGGFKAIAEHCAAALADQAHNGEPSANVRDDPEYGRDEPLEDALRELGYS